MNPPRFEMEHALKKFLTLHGISIKKPHIERPKPVQEGAEPKSAAVKKRKRRRSINKDQNNSENLHAETQRR
jgi:hypothetical protein